MTVREEWGMACPECKSDEDLSIYATSVVLVSLLGDGSVEENGGGDNEWGNDSECHCDACGWSGTVLDAEHATGKPYTVILRIPDHHDQGNNGFGGTVQSHEKAFSPEEAVIQAKNDNAGDHQDDPDAWQRVAVFAGHLTELIVP